MEVFFIVCSFMAICFGTVRLPKQKFFNVWSSYANLCFPMFFPPNRAPFNGVLALKRTGCPLHTPRKVWAVWFCCITLLKNTRFCTDSGISMATFCSKVALKPMLFYGPCSAPVLVTHQIVEKPQVL